MLKGVKGRIYEFKSKKKKNEFNFLFLIINV